MTYFGFHCRFNFPLLALLLWCNARFGWTQIELFSLFLILLAVLIFTAPWDNFAAKRKIWGFSLGKYLFKIGYLPVEEYLFFVLQTTNVILAERFLLFFFSWQTHFATPLGKMQGIWGFLLFLGWLALGLQFWRNRPVRRFHYAIHLLFWFLPVLFLQWILAGLMLVSHLGFLLFLTFAFGLYYSVADLVAVRAKIWFFDESQITGLKWRGVLPWEEIAFFFLTTLLIAQSYLLLLPIELR